MTFQQIENNGQIFTPSGDGRYMSQAVTFGAPLNYFRISAGSLNKKTGLTSAAITRVFEKDLSSNGDVVRKSCSVQLVIQTPSGFTVEEIDFLADQISQFATQATLTRIMMGES